MSRLVDTVDQDHYIQSRHLESPPKSGPQGKLVSVTLRKSDLQSEYKKSCSCQWVRSVQILQSNSLSGS